MDLAKVDEFIDLFDSDADEEEVEMIEGDEVELFRDDISEETTKIIVMERCRS